MGGGPPGHFFDATPVEVKSGQNLVFPLKKGRVSLCGKRGLDLHRGRKFVSVRGGPHPHLPISATKHVFLRCLRRAGLGYFSRGAAETAILYL